MSNNSMSKLLATIFLVCAVQLFMASVAFSTENADLKFFVGKWTRTDGGYVIHVRDVQPDGSVEVEYYNPKKINIAEAHVSEWKGMGKLFLKLQDEGYPGSTYTLYYHAEKDALAGFYHQAAINQRFEVVFVRVKTSQGSK